MSRQAIYELIAECVGTFLLVLFGVGSVHVAVLTGELTGLGQVAIVWGLGVGLAIYATAAISGAHLNPAVTVAIATFRGFPWLKAPLYVFAQVLGAVLAAALLYALFHAFIADFESALGLVRGEPGSQRSAMMYGEYFPNPAIVGVDGPAFALVSHPQAMLAEGLGTALLVFFIFALTDAHNRNAPTPRGVAFPIGLTVTAIVCLLAVLTQAGLNPARDFGPRLFAYFAGWGPIAIPGPRNGFFTVYVLSPIIGGVLGAGAYQWLLRPHLTRTAPETSPS